MLNKSFRHATKKVCWEAIFNYSWLLIASFLSDNLFGRLLVFNSYYSVLMLEQKSVMGNILCEMVRSEGVPFLCYGT